MSDFDWYAESGWGRPVSPPPPSPPSRRRRYGGMAALAAGTMVASAAVTHSLWPATATHSAAALPAPSAPETTVPPAASPAVPGNSGSPSAGNASVTSKVVSALVDVNTTFGYQQAAGAGTGIVLTSDGEVLTNNHVIDGATTIAVTDIGNGRTYRATVLGYDASADVALLRLSGASGLATAPLGDSANLSVGAPVVAVGNAGGQGSPIPASGSITALDQQITASDELDGVSENLAGLIETDAAIQPGDSGGALVDSAGRVIGMNTAASTGYSLQSDTTAAYAIPIDAALGVVQSIESGNASATVHVGPTAFLGVSISSGSGGFSSPASPGATIAGVVAGGAAATAGLSAGDVITAVDGSPVSAPSDLSRIISADHPGQTVTVTWTDPSGASHTAPATLRSGPPA